MKHGLRRRPVIANMNEIAVRCQKHVVSTIGRLLNNWNDIPNALPVFVGFENVEIAIAGNRECNKMMAVEKKLLVIGESLL